MEYLKVWTTFRELLEPLTDAERGRLFVAMLEYAESGAEPQLSGSERYVWPAARQSINNTRDRNEQLKANGSKPKQSEANESKGKQTEAKGSKPKQSEAKRSNLFDKEKDKVKDNYTTTTTARAREEDTILGQVTVDPLIIKVQQELNGLTDTHYNALDDYRRDLGDEIVSYAIDTAVGNGVRNWSYVEAILRGWLQSGVKSVGEAKAEQERHKRQPQKRNGKVVSAQCYDQRDYNGTELEKALGVDSLWQ